MSGGGNLLRRSFVPVLVFVGIVVAALYIQRNSTFHSGFATYMVRTSNSGEGTEDAEDVRAAATSSSPQLPPSVPLSAVIHTVYDEVTAGCVDVALESIARASVFPAETILLVDGIDLEDPEHVKVARTYMTEHNWEERIPGIHAIFRPGTHSRHDNMNYGSAVASQPYVTLLHGDDVAHPDRWRLLYEAFQERPHVGLLLARHTVAYGLEANTFQEPFPSDHGPTFVYDGEWISDHYAKFFAGGGDFMPCCWDFEAPETFSRGEAQNGWMAFRQDVRDAVVFRDTNGPAEDAAFVSDTVRHGFVANVLDESLGLYRVRDNGQKICR
ncbi:unnamed protein product [Pedinophyceae sp. YPF-701]|nr:unnamed protein product [Pedinophyceae sp. YPF-701]